MNYHPDKHHRHSIRLQGYDYSSQGLYFVTICTYQRECLFGEIIAGKMELSEVGRVVAEEWQMSSQIRQEIELDVWVIMPNHIHGIVLISNVDVGANGGSPHAGLAGINRSELPDLHYEKRANSHSPLRGISMKPRSLSSLMAGFKSATTKRINLLRDAPGMPVWQRNYYEHIIRNKESLRVIREYVRQNPLVWDVDQLHPSNPSKW
jgi:putative transposase